MSCHGAGMEGGTASSMLDDEWVYGRDDAIMADVIRSGRVEDGMPSFAALLTDQQIRSLVIFIQEKNARAEPEPPPEPLSGEVLRGGGHEYRLETLAEDLDLPWSLAFFPDGDWLVAERGGRLLRIDPETGRRLEIRGVPEVYAEGQGGLLDVELHPEFAENGWIYLSFSAPDRSGKNGLTKIVRGRIRGDRWIDEETVFEAPQRFYTGGRVHFGTRLVFDGDYLFFAIGDRGRQDEAQDLSRPNGKIHRIRHDGTVPDDNPFVDRPDAFPTIWTYGNRNPQGMALDPASGRLWATEHGPRGGDELNRIRKGLNYGWPVVTHGMNYNGTPITDRVSAPGMEDPVVQWTPSLAVCGLAFYDGDAFPEWRGDLLSGGLASEEVRLISLEGESVTGQELIVHGRGRVRDVVVGPDGLPYVVFNAPGRIARIVPVESPR